MPPAVLIAATVPTSPPTRSAPAARRAAAGNAAPSSVVGTSRMAAEATMNLATTSMVSRPDRRIAHMPAQVCASESQVPRTAALPMALTPAAASRTPKVHHGSWRGPREAREEGAAEGEAREIRAQHHRERVRARAQELHEQLRPHDFVTERHAAGDGVQRESGASVAGWRSGGTFGPRRRHLRGGRRSRSSASAAAATARPTHAANMPAP